MVLLEAHDSIENKLARDQNQNGQKDRLIRNRYIQLLILDFSVSDEYFTFRKMTRLKEQHYTI